MYLSPSGISIHCWALAWINIPLGLQNVPSLLVNKFPILAISDRHHKICIFLSLSSSIRVPFPSSFAFFCPSLHFGLPQGSFYAAAAAKSLQSCLTLCDPIDGSPPGSPVPGILQARTLEWVAISFSNAWKRKVKVKSPSHVWLFSDPMDWVRSISHNCDWYPLISWERKIWKMHFDIGNLNKGFLFWFFFYFIFFNFFIFF